MFILTSKIHPTSESGFFLLLNALSSIDLVVILKFLVKNVICRIKIVLKLILMMHQIILIFNLNIIHNLNTN